MARYSKKITIELEASGETGFEKKLSKILRLQSSTFALANGTVRTIYQPNKNGDAVEILLVRAGVRPDRRSDKTAIPS